MNAPDGYDTSGKNWVFSSWSDGGARSHTVSVPGADATYTATFAPGAAGPAGLVAAYAFDENSGTAIGDSSGKGNNGTTASTTWAVGKFGSALSFNGSSSWVTIPDSPSLDLARSLTLEAWVKPTTVSGWRSVAMKERTGGILYSLYAGESGNRPLGQVDNGAEQNATGTTSLPTNTWSHLAVAWDGATLRLYVGGALVASKAVAGSLAASTAPFRIGGNGIWGEYFSGAIDEVRVYDHALTPSEIQTDMSRPIGQAPDTVAPSVPGTPTASVAGSSVTLAWAGSTDNVGVARYRVYRSTTSGFTPGGCESDWDADVGGVHGLGACCGDVLLQGDGGGCCRQRECGVRSGIGDGCCGAGHGCAVGAGDPDGECGGLVGDACVGWFDRQCRGCALSRVSLDDEWVHAWRLQIRLGRRRRRGTRTRGLLRGRTTTR